MPPTASVRPRLLWALFALALLVRLAAVLARGEFHMPAPPSVVGQEAGAMASYLLDGRGFASPFDHGASPSTHLPPVYPLLLAGLTLLQHALGGPATPAAGTFYGALALNLLASALVPVVTAKIAQAAGWPRGVALLAALAMCLCPEALRAAGLVWDEALFALAVALLLWLMVRQLQSPLTGIDAPAKIGLAGGAVSLLNPAFVPALVAGWIVAVAAAVRDQPPARQVRLVATHLVVVTATLLAAGSPWHIRNWLLLDPPALVFVRGNFPLEVWTSLNPVYWTPDPAGHLRGTPVHPWNGTDPLERDGQKLTEQEYFAWCRQRVAGIIHEEPRRFLAHVGEQIESFWLGLGEARRWHRNPTLFFLAQGVPALLGLAGLIAARRRLTGPQAVLITALLLIFPLPYYLAGGAARYRHPIDPVLYLGIAWLLWMLAGAGKKQGAGSRRKEEAPGPSPT